MSRGSDDDALSWAGDEDPTPDSRSAASREPVALPPGFTPVGKGSENLAPAEPDAGPDPGAGAAPATAGEAPATAGAAPGMGNAALVGIGILGGVYLFLTIGWLLGGARLALIAQLFLDPVAFQVAFWLAVAAPALFFGTVYLLTRGSRPWVRFALLTAGAVLLVPWPFVLAGSGLS